MMAGTCALFWLTVYTCVYICPAQKIITAEVGQNVILPCQVPDCYKSFTALECSFGVDSSQNPKHYIVFRNGRISHYDQHPSYKNRVHVNEEDVKHGNFSSTLKSVMMKDNGTYRCRVFLGTKNEIICNNTLEVHLPGDQDGNTGNGENKNGGSMALIFGLILGLSELGFLGF